MNNFGSFTLIVSFSLMLFSIIQTSYGILKNNKKAIELGKYCLVANFGVVLLAFLTLLTGLARMDLSNHYVVMHSSKHLSVFYQLTSIWAGSSGSLLFWNLLLSFFTLIAVFQVSKLEHKRNPYMNLLLAVFGAFFSFLAIFFEDAQAFKEFRPEAVVGRGLNPLLQHWAMIIHPPILYIGYVSFAIPFAIAMSALFTGEYKADWLKLIRKWSLFSWFFLGVGILLGSKWAYEELGWGGYWAWDPVENASLMPWLLASAFLHSIIIQERRGMLKFWNFFIIILTFHFTLLGTWITRSGVLEGPHSFSQSSIGTPFILFIGLSFFFHCGILILKRDYLKPERNLEAITSKEGSFFLNNFILILACMVILLGVFSPLLYGKEFKSPWYNAWGIPAGLFLLFLMGVSPLLAWRKGADKVFFSTLFKPALVGLLCGIVYSFVYSNFFTKSDHSVNDILSEIYSVLTIGLGGLTLAGIFQEFYRGVRARKERHQNENYFVSTYRLILQNKRRYGGYLVHFSIVLLFVGYSGNAFQQNTSIKYFYHLAPLQGEEIVYVSQDKGIIGNYEIEANALKIKPLINGDQNASPNLFNVIVTEEASFKIRTALSQANVLKTERRFYPQISHLSGRLETQIPTSEPAIQSKPKEDLYIQLGALESVDSQSENPDLPLLFMDFFFGANSFQEKQEMFSKFPTQIIGNLEIWVNPLVKLIWIGSLLFFLSGLFILFPIGEK
ncbi:MAG: heme lyase CcmF/NrfE family subunit [Leptospiraceae bacterium]|nr:heme lyase CcmF/NrfE family subunit [Leptospiraceae bacterium]MCP5497064.1 heme lyase CcmF/NrfE family subunit [Leptospiraceae bacterium]